MSTCEFTVIEIGDRDDPSRPICVHVRALDQTLGISNTTERDVRIVVGGEERVLCPSPRRGECIVAGILLWRVSGTFDFRAIGDPHLVEPVEVDALCAELLLPGGASGIH